MKHTYILTALALSSILLAGCGSSECDDGEFKADCNGGNISKCVDGKWTQATCDNGSSCNAENYCGDCKNDEVKKDCKEGKYSKCLNGKWTETACENGFSCNAENQCGECKDGDEKECKEGKVNRCINGKYQEADCENNTSCTTDGKCGECKNGDTTKCTNDSERVGSAIVCKDGKWSANEEKCPDMFSCSMTDECYQCYNNCRSQFICNDDCKDTTCKVKCDNYAACIKQCEDKNNGCDSKCGECTNDDHINCTEKNGVGSADFCYNGKWGKNYDCATIYQAIHNVAGLTVSCTKKCTKQCGSDGSTCCRDDEYISICGECQTGDDLICVQEYDSRYGVFYPQFSHSFQLVKCVEGKISLNPKDGATPCNSSCFSQDGYDACRQNVETGK